MKTLSMKWWPAGLLAVGVVVTSAGVHTQRVVPLVSPLDVTVSREYLGWQATDIEVSEAEQQVAGMTSYVMRLYQQPGVEAELAAASAFSVYVGYYESQSQGKTIHSPKNCLPGGGWEPLVSSRETIQTSLGAIPVNRYLIGNGPAQAVVLYWYQGRGRVAANEYVVKWDLLRDQALHGRSDEALVRVIVPVTTTDEDAYEKAVLVARDLVMDVDRALPDREI
ncbi:MAG TPA: EpsI family protein [Longimicrobiales bacterium]|nr:EpsI family protein [Longimicrobiales bacterium]